MRRPLGITVLAILNFIEAFCCLGFAVGIVLVPRVLSALLYWWDSSDPGVSEYGLGMSLWEALLTCLVAILVSFYAWGFWRLKNWARIICIFFSILNISYLGGADALYPLPLFLSDKVAPEIWPHSHFVVSGLLAALLSSVASVAVLAYLLRSPVKAAFGASPAEWKWIAAVTALALVSLGHSLYKSSPEFAAIRWHANHGDTVVVNGVSLPVDYWSVPDLFPDNSGVSIENWPGPLRPERKQQEMYVKVLGFKTDDERDLTVNERVERRIQSYHRSHYDRLTQFQLDVAKQALYCVHEHEFAFSGGSLYCYGDGPIYSVFFTGSSSGLERLKDMMAEAKYVPSSPKS